MPTPSPTREMIEALAALESHIPQPSTSGPYKLDRMRALLDLLGNPQEQFKAVHVAGTSGKTSTSYFIRGVLESAGVRTGLTVSPHIETIRERVQVGGRPLPETDFADYTRRLLRIVGGSGTRPTYFELLVALAYVVFREEGVEYAVIETGLGGLLDATNTITREDKTCVITDIGLDHTEVLGSTIEEIASQKAGIIHAGNDVLVQSQADPALSVIIAAAERSGARRVKVVGAPNSRAEAGPMALPQFQRRNWRLAVATYGMLAKRDDALPGPKLIGKLNPLELQPPGRMEEYAYKGKSLLLDGAHNPQKLQAACESLRERGWASLTVVASFINAPAEKLDESLRVLSGIADNLIVPEFAVVQDLNKASPSAQSMADRAQANGIHDVQAVPDLCQALGSALAMSEDRVLVTGSLYLVAQARELLGAMGAVRVAGKASGE